MSKMNRNQKAMLFAEGIVERYRARGNQLPHRSKTCRMDPNREQVTPESIHETSSCSYCSITLCSHLLFI